jgi:hypothetical protein
MNLSPFSRSRDEARWPPYRLVEDTLADGARRKLEKLERLYHAGQDAAWDGKKVLADLIAQHGPPRLDPARREPALKLLSILLWGELAAWAISADLAERIDDIEAKMAATSQAHDEARHFYVLRDYLRALGDPVPHLGGIGRRLLVDILETDSLVHKLVGMQLLVESNALSIFRGLVEAKVEPVLEHLLPYYERDEARHVGLGVMYLPRLLARLSGVEAASVALFQVRCVGMLLSAGLTMREDFRALDMDPRRMASHTVKLQSQIVGDMLATGGTARRRDAARGLLDPGKGFGPRILDFVHPPVAVAELPRWHRVALRAWTGAARYADRALA